MYAVSEEYKKAMKKTVQRFRMTGTVGTVPFTDDNILAGSFSITNQCSGGTDVQIGQVYVGELDVTLMRLGLDRYSFRNRQIRPKFGRLIEGSTYEDIPLGVYNISEANWTASGVVIKAYDNMSKFDKNCSLSTTTGGIYDFMELACQECGVEFGMTRQQVGELANGQETLSFYEENDIETWRDLVSWCAATAGCNAFADREGKIIFREYGQEVVDRINDENRLSGASFSDFETRYTGLSVVNIADKTTTYYAADNDDALTYNAGQNPLLQYGTETVRTRQRQAVLKALEKIDYVPFAASMIGDPAYDLMDVLVFSGGIADGSKLYCITKFSFKYHGAYEIEGVGENPALASAKSKSDKNIAGLMSSTSSDSIHYYDYINAKEIHVGDGDKGRIIEFHYVTTKDTHVDFHAEIVYKLETTETYDETEETYTENDGVLKVSYILNGENVTDYYPVETRLDGTHLLHLMFTWTATANVIGTFYVDLELEGGAVDIGLGNARAYIAGQGLVGDGTWDGSVNITDKVRQMDVCDVLTGDISDDIAVIFSEAKDFTLRDSIANVDLLDYLTQAFTDKVEEAHRLHHFDVPYSQSIMAYDGVIVDGTLWKNKNLEKTGTLTTPDCSVDKVLRVTSKHSGDDVAYIVSFDGGTTWWTYADNWAEPDYTQDVYGMFEGTMRSISETAWAEKLNGSIMVRAILVGSATVTDIQIYTEDIGE